MSLKQCIHCYEEIKKEATICKHCGSHQKPYKKERLLAYTTAILSLVLSIFSVSAVMLTTGKSLFESKVAKVEFDVIQTNGNKLSVIVRNEGNVPAVLVDGILSNYLDDGPLMAFRIPINKPVLIDSGKYHIVTLLPYGGVPSLLDDFYENYKCRASLKIAQLGKTQEFKTKEFPCLPNENMQSFLEEIKLKSDIKANNANADDAKSSAAD